MSAFLNARGAPPPLAYALRAAAFGLSARLRRAAWVSIAHRLFSSRATKGPHSAMRKNVLVLALLATTLIGIQLHASDAMKAIVGSYLEIQSQLVTDKIDGVKASAKSIGAQAARMGSTGQD